MKMLRTMKSMAAVRRKPGVVKAIAMMKASKKTTTGRKTVQRSQTDLENAILHRCAAGRDHLDKQRAPDVKIVRVPLGATGIRQFPQQWTRHENGVRETRGHAEWYVPEGVDTSRRMLCLHGGTFVVWKPQDACYRSLYTRIAKACGVCVLAIDYRNAPEHLFPAAFDDATAALNWMAEHGPESAQEVSPATDIFVCGDSAGGNLALAVCVAPAALVRSRIRGVIGLSAWLDLTASTASYDTRQWDVERCFGDATNVGNDRKGGRGEAEGYLGRGGVEKHGRAWRASPFFAPAAKLCKMPPALFHVGDYELILDESVELCEKMKKAGHKDATVAVYPRMWHVWHQYSEGGGERQTLDKGVRAVNDIGRWVVARKS